MDTDTQKIKQLAQCAPLLKIQPGQKATSSIYLVPDYADLQLSLAN